MGVDTLLFCKRGDGRLLRRIERRVSAVLSSDRGRAESWICMRICAMDCYPGVNRRKRPLTPKAMLFCLHRLIGWKTKQSKKFSR